ncbi:hypothetical protein Airi02_034670 [Actinoallomurus iriomotensis]|uniref:Uncharacterized protein n=1 Tax=Actinoallomurus iriomotensis TaxID=478107 RepID=A0A9W6VUF4_9ACTN|nr:hypothetical protein Airi02_034670 [Actinoallomurus iriomotensis]
MRDGPHGAIDDDLTVLGDLQPAGGGDGVDREPGRPHGRVGCQGGAVGAQHPRRFDGFDAGVLQDGDAQPVAGLAQVTAASGGEAGARLAAGDQRHRHIRPGFGELGGGLDAGQPVADDHHTPAFAPSAQAVQALAQAQRRGPGGDVEGVLEHTGYAAVGAVAAERVQERVAAVLTVAIDAGHGDDLALGVDGGDTGHTQPYPRAREDVGELRSLDLPAGRQLVQPQPLDEVRHGVDHGDLGVRRGQPAGQRPGHVGPGIAGAEDDDAMLHDAPVGSLASGDLSGTAPRLLTGTSCGMGHRTAGTSSNDAHDAEAAQTQAERGDLTPITVRGR